MRNRIGIVAASSVVAASLLGVLGAATAASATNTADSRANSVITQNTTSFNAPSQKAVRVHSLHQGEQVQALCYREGQEINGNFNWFKIDYRGDVSYVHRDAISAPHDLKHC